MPFWSWLDDPFSGAPRHSEMSANRAVQMQPLHPGELDISMRHKGMAIPRTDPRSSSDQIWSNLARRLVPRRDEVRPWLPGGSGIGLCESAPPGEMEGIQSHAGQPRRSRSFSASVAIDRRQNAETRDQDPCARNPAFT